VVLPTRSPEEDTMVDPKSLPPEDPRRHTMQMRARLSDLARHLREDVLKVHDERAKALFETSAEVLIGLERAFADYEAAEEPAWR
jgi:hypothetical protein